MEITALADYNGESVTYGEIDIYIFLLLCLGLWLFDFLFWIILTFNGYPFLDGCGNAISFIVAFDKFFTFAVISS